ncbi:MAG: glutamate racemase [Bradymonadia bacterium]
MTPRLTPTRPAALGIFDSGLGGLTVAAAIAARLPTEPMIYLGDTARVPYGTRSPATIVRYAHTNARFLLSQGVKLIVIACNTVSAQGLGGLADGSPIPIVGVIRPGAAAAVRASKGGAIAVLGTASTIRSQAYEHAIHERAPGRQIHAIACPLLVPLVEEGWLTHSVTRQVVEEYLAPLAGTHVDTIILGCTHYPLLTEIFESVAEQVLKRPVAIVDSAHATAERVATVLAQLDALAPVGQSTGSVESAQGSGSAMRRFFVTDATDRVGPVAARFWGAKVQEPLVFEHVDVTDGGATR